MVTVFEEGGPGVFIFITEKTAPTVQNIKKQHCSSEMSDVT